MAAEGMAGGKQRAEGGAGRKRVWQLVICVVLFTVVFAGRGVDCGPLTQLADTVEALVQWDADWEETAAQVQTVLDAGWTRLCAVWAETDPSPADAQPPESDQIVSQESAPAPGDA